MTSVGIAFLFYLLLIVLVGALAGKKMSGNRDFFLGAQRLPGWMVTISERASGESAWLLLGLTGAALVYGLAEIWTVLGCILGILVLWFVYARPLREAIEETDAITVPELIAQRLHDPGKSLRATATVILLFFFTLYVSSQMIGAGKILIKTNLIPQAWQTPIGAFSLTGESLGILIGAFVVIAYTLVGGFKAVVWTDLIQGLIMVLTLLILPIVGLFSILHTAETVTLREILSPHQIDLFAGKRGLEAVTLVLGGIAWGLGYVGQPHLLVRLMALPRSEEIRSLRWLAALWTIIAYGGAFALGLIALTLFGAQLHEMDPEKIMPSMALHLLPGWLAGIVISGAIAAMMSTADSQLLVTASAIVEDVYHRLIGKNLTPRAQVMLSRMVTLAIGLLATSLALHSGETIYDMVSFAWSGLGASFGPVVTLMLFWPRFDRHGALAAMITGSMMTILWKLSPFDAFISHRFISWVLALTAGFLISKKKAAG